MKTYPLKVDEETINLIPIACKYADGKSLAVLLYTEDGEDYADITVNISETKIWGGDDKAFVDTNNCPWAIDFIEENGIGTPVGHIGHSGFCTYPLYMFNLDKFDKEEDRL